ncbi:hypothetical protein PG993_008310 [Apiospora rasikravindrae]|uniref:Uncharacterized protein n=1 Tax=Apiospora rasikravindrae TaxID=990691 RepID=A0ABR1T007_9PEZI
MRARRRAPVRLPELLPRPPLRRLSVGRHHPVQRSVPHRLPVLLPRRPRRGREHQVPQLPPRRAREVVPHERRRAVLAADAPEGRLGVRGAPYARRVGGFRLELGEQRVQRRQHVFRHERPEPAVVVGAEAAAQAATQGRQGVGLPRFEDGGGGGHAGGRGGVGVRLRSLVVGADELLLVEQAAVRDEVEGMAGCVGVFEAAALLGDAG